MAAASEDFLSSDAVVGSPGQGKVVEVEIVERMASLSVSGVSSFSEKKGFASSLGSTAAVDSRGLGTEDGRVEMAG